MQDDVRQTKAAHEGRADDELFSNPMQRGFEKIVTPFQGFIRDETTASVLLLICTVAALVLANSSWSEAYTALLHTRIGVSVGDFTFGKDLHHWINDGFMALFFFVIGLEIKREGEVLGRHGRRLPEVVWFDILRITRGRAVATQR